MTRYSGLILDFGGVLTTSVPDCASGFDAREGLSPGTLLNTIAVNPQGRELYADLERGAIGQTEWNTRTAAILGIDGTNLLQRVLIDLHPEQSVIDAAQAARRQGVKVGIFSNSLGVHPYNPYDGYGFDDGMYDAILISEHHRMRKPDPGIYKIMLGLMNLPAQSCVFADDTARNLPPATELGMATVLATDPAATVRQLEALFRIPLTGQV